MNHTPIKVIPVAAGANATITDKHRAVIISNTGNFVIRLVVNSGPFYIPCRVKSISVTGSNASILLLA